MGRVAVCHGSLGTAAGEVRAMLESEVIQLRGDIQSNVAFGELKNVRAEGEHFLAVANGKPLALKLGQKESLLWVRKILHPPTLADKLGLAQGLPIHVHGRHAEALRVVEPAGVRLVPLAKARLAFLVVDTPLHLEALKALAEGKPADAQIWIVRRKGKDALVRESSIMAVAKEAGLSPSKTSAWSEAYSADRYGSRSPSTRG